MSCDYEIGEVTEAQGKITKKNSDIIYDKALEYSLNNKSKIELDLDYERKVATEAEKHYEKHKSDSINWEKYDGPDYEMYRSSKPRREVELVMRI